MTINIKDVFLDPRIEQSELDKQFDKTNSPFLRLVVKKTEMERRRERHVRESIGSGWLSTLYVVAARLGEMDEKALRDEFENITIMGNALPPSNYIASISFSFSFSEKEQRCYLRMGLTMDTLGGMIKPVKAMRPSYYIGSNIPLTDPLTIDYSPLISAMIWCYLSTDRNAKRRSMVAEENVWVRVKGPLEEPSDSKPEKLTDKQLIEYLNNEMRTPGLRRLVVGRFFITIDGGNERWERTRQDLSV